MGFAAVDKAAKPPAFPPYRARMATGRNQNRAKQNGWDGTKAGGKGGAP